jgi:SNF2 family DNA or RNA helicase
MGLGKSLQVCALIHAFCKRQMARAHARKQNPKASSTSEDATARVMLVVPSSLLDNWGNEFKKWINKGKQDIRVSILSASNAHTPAARLSALRAWNARPESVLIIGYEMYTNLAKTYTIDAKRALLTSADLIILDEGHRIKSATSKTAQVQYICITHSLRGCVSCMSVPLHVGMCL